MFDWRLFVIGDSYVLDMYVISRRKNSKLRQITHHDGWMDLKIACETKGSLTHAIY